MGWFRGFGPVGRIGSGWVELGQVRESGQVGRSGVGVGFGWVR